MSSESSLARSLDSAADSLSVKYLEIVGIVRREFESSTTPLAINCGVSIRATRSRLQAGEYSSDGASAVLLVVHRVIIRSLLSFSCPLKDRAAIIRTRISEDSLRPHSENMLREFVIKSIIVPDTSGGADSTLVGNDTHDVFGERRVSDNTPQLSGTPLDWPLDEWI